MCVKYFLCHNLHREIIFIFLLYSKISGYISYHTSFIIVIGFKCLFVRVGSHCSVDPSIFSTVMKHYSIPKATQLDFALTQ